VSARIESRQLCVCVCGWVFERGIPSMRTGFADLFGDSDVDDGQGELVGIQDLHQRLQRLGLVRPRRHANGAHHRQIGVGQQL
jgi:hypothetical protein